MNEAQELLNVRLIRVTTEAALLTVPAQADLHRRKAAQLLDDAEERTSSPRVREEIAAVREHLASIAPEARNEDVDA